MIMIFWVNSAFIMNITWCTKKRNTAIIMKITWYTKKKVETIMNIMVHQKSSSPRLWTYLVHKKFFFETLWSYLVNQKNFLRKVRSYFVNLLQNNDLLCFFFVPEIFLANILPRFCLLSGVLVVLWWTRNDSSKVIGNCNGLHKILWWLNYPLWSYLLLWRQVLSDFEA